MERFPFASPEADSSSKKEEKNKKKTTRIPKKALEAADVHEKRADTENPGHKERIVKPTQNILERMFEGDERAEKEDEKNSNRKQELTEKIETEDTEKVDKNVVELDTAAPLNESIVLAERDPEAEPATEEGEIKDEGEIRLSQTILASGAGVDDSHEVEPRGVIVDNGEKLDELSITEEVEAGEESAQVSSPEAAEVESAVDEPEDLESTLDPDEDDPLAGVATGHGGGSSGSGSGGTGSGRHGGGAGGGGTGSGSGSHYYGYSHYLGPPSPGMSPLDFERALEDAEYRGRKSGKRSGALAWLTAGWLIGRHGKKKAAREHTKEIKAKDKEIGELTEEQWLARERIEAVKRNQENIEENLQHSRAQLAPQPSKAEKQPNAQPLAAMPKVEAKPGVAVPLVGLMGEKPSPSLRAEAAANQAEKLTDSLKSVPAFEFPPVLPLRPEANMPASAEATPYDYERIPEAVRSKERLVKDLESQKEKLEEAAELTPEEREITEELYATDKDRRVDLSSWHRMEVDPKTGKLLSEQEVGYGKEFKQERKQEVFKEKNTDSAPAGGGGGGSDGGGSAAAAQQLGQIGVSVASGAASPESRSEVGGLEVPSIPMTDDMFKPSWTTTPAKPTRYITSPYVWAVGFIVTGIILLFIFL